MPQFIWEIRDYRYSFYLDGTYDIHEVGVSILLDLIPPRWYKLRS